MFETFVDAQSKNGHILLEFVHTYPSVAKIAAGILLITVCLVAVAIVADGKNNSEKR